MKMRLLGSLGLAGLAMAMPASVCHAVINHPGDDSILGTLPRPTGNVVGRWNVDDANFANASVVAIDPNHAVTVRHQGFDGNAAVGLIVTFGSNRYKISQSTAIGNADLRVLTLTQEFSNAPANLSDYTPVYGGTTASLTAGLGTPTSIGGFGRPRNASLLDPNGQVYGYSWNSSVHDVNATSLAYGRNTIEDAQPVEITVDGNTYTSNAILADFDSQALGIPGESDLSQWDSGGGWFVNVSGNWFVAGLSEGTQHDPAFNANEPNGPGNGQALFGRHDNTLPGAHPAPDALFAVDLASYQSQITSAVPEPSSACALASIGAMGVLRRRQRARLS